MDALALLSGDARTFVEKVWASRIHVQHREPSDLVGLLSLDDVDHLLTSTALRTPALRLAHDGEVLPSSRFTKSASLAGVKLSGLVDARKVYDLFAGGATVVLQGLHRYWPPLTELVRDLELALGHPCQANAYLTPPGSQGFAVHSDSHDVFVFQTSGVKQWEVQDESGSRDVLLEPGVSMYLPTGTPHAARSQDVASLHVTIGINQVTWRDVMGRVVQHVLDDTDEMDAALPAGYLEDRGEVTDGVRDRLELLAARLAHADPEAAADAEVTRFLTSRPSLLRGGLHDLTRLREIDQDTALRRRPGSACVLVPGDDVLRVLLGDRELRVPARLVDPMTYVREQETLRPADLASWLDTDSRLVLARRLVREGLLQVEA